jgi:hypothetical protein
MRNSISLCGASTKFGGTCRNQVERSRLRCHLHRTWLDKERVFALCMKVTKAVSIACTAYKAYETLYPIVAPHVHALHGLLMPEHFWLAFDAGDANEMGVQLERAKKESAQVIKGRYEGYTAAEKQRVVAAYEQILEALGREGVTT